MYEQTESQLDWQVAERITFSSLVVTPNEKFESSLVQEEEVPFPFGRIYEAAFSSGKKSDQRGRSLSSKTTSQTAYRVRKQSSAQECKQNKIAVSPELKSAS